MQKRQFPSFDLARLLQTTLKPKVGEKLCILIDLDDPKDIINLAFLKKANNEPQKKAYEVFYRGLKQEAMQKLGITVCDLYAYKKTGGSNLELPNTAISLEGKTVKLDCDIYPVYQLILCIGLFSATAPLTAMAKKYGFRGATMHGVNDIILNSGLAVDYHEVSRETEQLRLGMTKADYIDIDFSLNDKNYQLHIDLGRQEAQKSHGICHIAPDIANLPAGEVYFVPQNASGKFPFKFEDGTLAVMDVVNCKVHHISLIKGNQKMVQELQSKIDQDPASGILGELGFGTQLYPYSKSDIQDEKIFGTFHIAIGRNDHLNGDVTPDKFVDPSRNATHDDILFSSTKTAEIQVKQVRMQRKGKKELLIENYQPSAYLIELIKPVTAHS